MSNVRPIEIDFRVATSPLVDIYDKERKLLRFLDELQKIQRISDSSSEFRELVNKGLRDLDYPTPIHAVFVDGIEGYQTDYPEFTRIPVLMIVPLNLTGKIYPTLQ
jgi:hypothetical protein